MGRGEKRENRGASIFGPGKGEKAAGGGEGSSHCQISRGKKREKIEQHLPKVHSGPREKGKWLLSVKLKNERGPANEGSIKNSGGQAHSESSVGIVKIEVYHKGLRGGKGVDR